MLLAAHVVGDSSVYATIQAAVDAAHPGDVVTVDAGQYAELVTINKPLTLLGSRAGVDARSNLRVVASESIITGVLDPAGSGNTISCIYVNANGVTVDGFVVQGNTSNGPLGAGIVIAPNKSGTTILDNILQNNVAGIYLANSSNNAAAVIRHNLFINNNNDGDHSGRGIYTDGGFSGGSLTNVTIDENAFINNFGSKATTTGLEAAISLQTLAANSQSNIRITDNMFDGNGKAALFFNTDNALIEGNIIAGCKDSGSAALRFEGGDSNVTIRGNTIYANYGNVIRVDNKVVPGANFNFVFTANNTWNNGISNAGHTSIFLDAGRYTGTFDATNNWWGSASGPGTAISGNGNNVISSPWATSPFAHPPQLSYLQVPWSDGGPIEIENFDQGGEGVAFHDLDSGNNGLANYRKPWGVDIQANAADPSGSFVGGYIVGYVKAGEWLQYTINLAQSASYNFGIRVASPTSGGKFHVTVDDVDVTGTLVVPNTTSYSIYKTVSKAGIPLSAGQHLLRLVMDTNNSAGSIGNLNWFKLTNVGAAPVTPPAAPSGLNVTSVDASKISLAWTDNSSDETSFIIERKTGTGGSWSIIATKPSGTTSFDDTSVSQNTTYTYRVRATNAGGDSANSNEVSATTPTAVSYVYLSDLAWVSATGGYGPVEKDMSNGGSGAGDGGPITLNGVVYSKGLGTHAPSEIIYNLAGGYDTFLSDVGVDDKQTVNGSIVFQVYADGVLIYDSGLMRATTATKSINVSVAGVQQLKLVVTDGGDGNDYDHADWAGARLIPSPASQPPPSAPANLTAVAVSSSRVDLNWSDATGENGYVIERSTDGGVTFAPIANVGADATSYSDLTVAPSTQYMYRVRATSSAGDSPNSNLATATTPATPSLPAPWNSNDIGNVGLAGGATYSNGTFTVNGAGSDIWGNADSFQFVNQQITGDFTIVARVASMTNTDALAKAGIMVRETLAANSKEAGIFVKPSAGTTFVRRSTTGGASSSNTSTGKSPIWLKLTRAGNTITSYQSIDGITWTMLGTTTISMSSTVYVGLAVTSHNTSWLNTATFDNVSITN